MKLRLEEEFDSAILARVAAQLVVIEMRQRPNSNRPPAHIVRFVVAALPVSGFGMLRFALHSLAVWLECGYKGKDWLAGVGYRASMGGNFRWHFFERYKENRSPYPRVTNRGVQNSSAGDASKGKKAKGNA